MERGKRDISYPTSLHIVCCRDSLRNSACVRNIEPGSRITSLLFSELPKSQEELLTSFFFSRWWAGSEFFRPYFGWVLKQLSFSPSPSSGTAEGLFSLKVIHSSEERKTHGQQRKKTQLIFGNPSFDWNIQTED